MNQSQISIKLQLEHTYAEQLPELAKTCAPRAVSQPSLLQFNHQLATELGGRFAELEDDLAALLFSGNLLADDANPIAQAYAGHQFGGFVPQLGDGRALLLGEIIDSNGQRRDIALKGSGQTPFSRGGDGRAAIGPVLREYLVGEAMHALGVPTSRALAAVATGEQVMRERPLPGAVICRVAASHIRVGTFQFPAARQQVDQLRKLADYVITRHYPEIAEDNAPYSSLLRVVLMRQAELVAKWMLVGFIHGVMNTDNTTISGETIDYGPCAFMETFHPETVFSSIDHAGRYAYGNQPTIALWNLARFAETLLPLSHLEDDQAIAEATETLDSFIPTFQEQFYSGIMSKFGLRTQLAEDKCSVVSDEDRQLADDWLELLQRNKVDYTLAWRGLADCASGNTSKLQALFTEQNELSSWIERWKRRLGSHAPETLATHMRSVNPIYIPRNHLVEEALSAAVAERDLSKFEKLLKAVRQPFEEMPEFTQFAEPAPSEFTSCYRTFCGT